MNYLEYFPLNPLNTVSVLYLHEIGGPPQGIRSLDEAEDGLAGRKASAAHQNSFQADAAKPCMLPAPECAVMRLAGDHRSGFAKRNELLRSQIDVHRACFWVTKGALHHTNRRSMIKQESMLTTDFF
jgi:hypothetical protein